MNCNSIISVSSILGPTIHTRQSASILLKAVSSEHCDHIDLDFSEVEYISRSFADEFHSEKISLVRSSNKKIIVRNANDKVIKMLQSVARTQNKDKRDFEEMPVYNYTDWNILNSFLLSI